MRRWWEQQRIFRILTILWMIVIFSFSAKNAQESTKDSSAVGMLVGRIVHADFKEWPNSRQQAFAEQWSYPIRKAAHMSEYAVLGFLLLGAVGPRRKEWTAVPAAFLMAVLYAASDEIHQFFVPGRACMITDVGYDALGAAVGIALGWGLVRWRNKNSN